MPLVLYRIVDDFDGLERNEDGDYEDGYSRIQTRELIEGWVTGATDGAPNLMVASTDGAPTDGARVGSQQPAVNGRPVTLTRSSQDSAAPSRRSKARHQAQARQSICPTLIIETILLTHCAKGRSFCRGSRKVEDGLL